MFTLIQDSDMWVISKTVSLINYVLTESAPVIVKKSGVTEPYNSGETSLILPSGITSEASLLVYSEHDLKTFNNLKGNTSNADLVTFIDPVANPDAMKYMIMDKEVWDANASFALLSTHQVYLAVRVEQQ